MQRVERATGAVQVLSSVPRPSVQRSVPRSEGVAELQQEDHSTTLSRPALAARAQRPRERTAASVGAPRHPPAFRPE
jgi:hypothetical protein